MRQAWLWLSLLLLFALPAQGAAQHGRGESSKGLNGAVEKLMEHRVELGITDAQLARVHEIKDSTDARKQPLWQQIMSVRRELKSRLKAAPELPESDRKALVRASGEQIETLLDEVRRIDHRAMREVGDVLTDAQKEKVRKMISRSRGGPDRSDNDRGREGSRH